VVGEEGDDRDGLAEAPQDQTDHPDERTDTEGDEDRPPRAAEHDREAGGGQGVAEDPRQRGWRHGAGADGPDACGDLSEGDGAALEAEDEPVRPGGLPRGQFHALGVHDRGGAGGDLAHHHQGGQDPDRERRSDAGGVTCLLERRSDVGDGAAGVEEQGAERAEQHPDRDRLAVDDLDVRLGSVDGVPQVRDCASDSDHESRS
jgi:hypothetical protein